VSLCAVVPLVPPIQQESKLKLQNASSSSRLRGTITGVVMNGALIPSVLDCSSSAGQVRNMIEGNNC
jgi:hypothetical protein